MRAATLDAGLVGGGIISVSRAILRSEGSVDRGFATSLCEISRIPLMVEVLEESDSWGSGLPADSQSLTVET